MTARACPRCQNQSLSPTGAYWACGVCRLAITQAALHRERGPSPQAGSLSREGGA